MARKTRTREHIIADYSSIHVERFALDCGYSIERITHDYGIDLLMFTYDANGEKENGCIYIQLKASDSPRYLSDGKTVSFSVDSADLEMWLGELMPVILILYDAQKRVAYWLHVQEYFRNRAFNLTTIGNTMTVHFRTTDILDEAAIRLFTLWKNEQHQRLGPSGGHERDE